LEVHESQVWDDWPEVESMAYQFQKEWAEFNQSKFCALLNNGTHTLQVALEALNIGYGDEVIVPGLTWQATASAVCNVNAIPVLVDVQSDTLCLDPHKVAAAITPRTRAIIPVHLYHRMVDMDELLSLAEKHRLHIIEDCAHTHGSQWDGKSAGTFGAFGSYSFQRSKLVNSAEGGALLMQDEDNYWKIVSQRSCGREYRTGIKIHSGNYRLTSFQAAVLRGQLAALKVNAPVMDQNGRALDEAIAKSPGVSPLRRNPHITRQCSYGYVFLYDKATYNGLDNPAFRKALSAELGFEFWTTYTPLSHSEVYYPHTKKRHQLNPEYLAAINPGHWELPVADDLWKNSAVLAHWPILACPPGRAHLLTDAIIKIYENRDELLKYASSQK
jgi:dTDP-4-amino-4,6-dideoxygalactose transaminase